MTIQILPYSLLVGQEQIKRALEVAYIAPKIGGVLISGHRGTGKSTAVRAFAQMMYDDLPVTLPINATEDRVVGGWYIDELMNAVRIKEEGLDAAKQPGLLELAHGKLLFVDEVNLLDDHIVNIILDVTATGVLVIQREERSDQKQVAFTLVGTMNPEEGGLRPQLLDRFGLTVNVMAETDDARRAEILTTVMAFERQISLVEQGQSSTYIDDARQDDMAHKQKLDAAKQRFNDVTFSSEMAQLCVRIAKYFNTEGHRADYVMALAAQAYASLQGTAEVRIEHIQAVAPLALMHRRPSMMQRSHGLWTQDDDTNLEQLLNNA